MKRVDKFSEFLINEAKKTQKDPKLKPDQVKVILEIMKKDVGPAIAIYSNFKKSFPAMFKSLEEAAKKEKTNLESILDAHFLKDPMLLHLLDEYPAVKKEVIKRTGVKDFSKLGRLGKLGVI